MVQATTTNAPSRFETSTPELHRSHDYDDDHVHVEYSSLVRWSAILAGTVAAVSMQIIFAVLGAAIGLSVISASTNTSEQGMSMAGGIWWLVTGLISLAFGGFLAGRLSGTSDRNHCALHGFLCWCTVNVLSAALVTSAGANVLGGSLSVVGNAIAGSADRGGSIASSIENTVNNRPSNADVNGTNFQVTETQQKEAAKNAAGASWWTVVALVMGAAVASIAGMSAVRDPLTVKAATRNTRIRDHAV